MGRTQLTSREITGIQRNDFDINTSGEAVITKVIAGSNMSITSSGVDAGTGDVILNVPIQKIITFGLRGNVTGDRLDTTLSLPFSGTIIKWKINCPSNETAEITIKKNQNIISIPSIVISNASNASDSNLINWQTGLVENDIIMASVVSKTTENLLTLQIIVTT